MGWKNQMNKKYNKCPVCSTDKFVTCIIGTYAEGRPVIVEGNAQHVSGDCIATEYYECDKCGGGFTVRYEINNGKTLYMKIDYNSERPDNEYVHTRA